MDHYKYIQLTFDNTLQEIIDEYNLAEISDNRNIYIDIWKGMYGLPQYRRIAYDRLKKLLNKHRYQSVKYPHNYETTKSYPSTSPSLLVALESNMLVRNIYSIQSKQSKNDTKPQ